MFTFNIIHKKDLSRTNVDLAIKLSERFYPENKIVTVSVWDEPSPLGYLISSPEDVKGIEQKILMDRKKYGVDYFVFSIANKWVSSIHYTSADIYEAKEEEELTGLPSRQIGFSIQLMSRQRSDAKTNEFIVFSKKETEPFMEMFADNCDFQYFSFED